jgi:L-ascorbate metabolism protein UlaG (beta-lactamase superfamily)
MAWASLLLALAAAVEVRYVANAGMLVAVDGARFLIDAPIREGIAPYATSPAPERARLESAAAPYDAVDAVLVTHWHEDHLSPEAVAAHLAANPGAVLVSSPEVVERVRAVAPRLSAPRLRAVLPAPGTSTSVTVAGVPVRVLRIRHNDARRFPEQHVGFLVGEHATVLHVGDADPTAANFALMRALPRVDVALLPFWYVLGAANRRLVEQIAPRRVVGMHLPPADAAEVGARLRAEAVEAVLATNPGQALPLDQ